MGNGFYNVVHAVLGTALKLFYPAKTEGLENIPAEGGFVLCLNHLSALDPLHVCARLPRKRRIFYLAKKELFKHKLIAAIIRGIGGIPVDRGNADIAAVRTTLQLAKEGKGIGIFPQGTRSDVVNPKPMLPGASMIALRAGVPVIPCYISPYGFLRKGRICFGKPIDFSDFGRRCDHDTLEAATARISDAVWGMK
ncbi:MAG: 1-acyl-sn-glycerol-3-phosphate acyltransferase [Clostridia bacterium]|nr:1-acyl-sn-glycerol-3-phosphate acyltransferase [Clostridia bacterium]